MRQVFTAVALALFLAVGAKEAVGQLRRGETTFDRNDQVLTWKTENRGAYTLNSKAGLKFDSILSTSLSMASGDNVKDRWYDNAYNNAELSYLFSDRIDLSFKAAEDWNRDTMSRLGKSLMTTNVDGGITYRAGRGLVLNGSAGHIYDSRFDNHDSGGRFGGGLRYTASPMRHLSFEMTGNGEKTLMKRSRDMYLGMGKLTYARNDFAVSLRINDDSDVRGYFSDIDRSSIEKRKRQEQNIVFSLGRGDMTALSDRTAYELMLNLGRKLIHDTANDDERSSKYQNNSDGDENGFGFRIGKSIARRVTTTWSMDYANVDNGVERLSRKRTQTDVGTAGSVFFGVSRADSLEISGMIKRTRIDTPVGVTNDRDELKFETGMTWRRYFNSFFETALDFRVLETHYVNIDVSQSAQNKWMKTYLLSPSLEFFPSRSLKIEHTVNVYANYITYDYDQDFSPRSNISRRVTSESWIDYAVSGDALVRMGMMFEENDYGLLNSKGDKLPAEEGIKRFGDVSVEYRFADWLVLVPSYIYAIRRDWTVSENSVSTIRREVDQTYGFSCRLFKNENGGVDLSFRRIVRTTAKYPVRIRDYITMRLTYGF